MTASHPRPDYDFILVGARCAGAATARLLALAGARVLVVDRGALGQDTLSTSFLMRGAVTQLHRWGLLPALVGARTPKVRTTYFHYASESIAVPLREGHGIDALYAPRRTVLDPILVSAARTAGAEVRFGARVSELLRDAQGRVKGVQLETSGARREHITAERVIGADGLWSSIARFTGAPTYNTGAHSAAAIYGYFESMPVDGYHWYYAHGLAAGAAPTNDGLSTVFVGAPNAQLFELRGDRRAGMARIANAVSPALGSALASARNVGPLRAFPGVRGFYRKPYGPGWALVGDAGYFRDPITAHGISDALRDAELLANALIAGEEASLARYKLTRDAATAQLFQASDDIASGAWDEARVAQLLRAANEGMRDGMRVVKAFDEARAESRVSAATAATEA